MAANEIHVGDTGTVIERVIVDNAVPVDLSGATVMRLMFRKPSGAVLTVDATLSSGGTDGKLRYVTQPGDLSEAGVWHLQVYVELPAWKGHSDAGFLNVSANLA